MGCNNLFDSDEFQFSVLSEKRSGLYLQPRVKVLIATSLAHLANDGNTYVFITLYPILFPLSYYTLGGSVVSSLFLIGILVALQNTSSVIASPFVGSFADRTGKHRALLSLGLFLLGVGIIGYALSVLVSGVQQFLLLVLFSIVAGIGGTFFHPLGAFVLSEVWSNQSIGRALGISGAGGSAGRAIYPLITTALVVYLTIPSTTVLAIFSFIIAFVVLTMLRGTDTKKYTTKEAKEKKSPISLKMILPSIFALTIYSFLKGIFSIGIVTFTPEYLERISGINYGVELGLILSIILISPIPGQLVFGFLADKIGRRVTLAITTVGSGVAILLLIYSHDVYLQVVLLAMFGFFTFTQFPLLMPLARSAVPKEAATLSNSIVWGIGSGGGDALGPFLVGGLAATSYLGGLNGSFLILTILSLCSLLLLPFIRMNKGVS